MKINELINWLETKPKFKPRENLNKIKDALKLINDPQNNYKAVHITGTNGKGSTSKYISSILAEKYNVGLFTSPYVIKFNERIQINNMPISDSDLKEYILWAKSFEQKFEKIHNESFSFFELLTIMTYKYFSDKKVDYAIIEVGIGGALDSTNVISSSLSIITSIGLDHVQQLGSTKEEILIQKLGIVNEGGVLITGLSEYGTLINNYIKKINGKVFYANLNDYKLLETFPLKIMYKNNIYTSNLLGLYQINNLITAISAINYLLPDLDVEIVKKGVSKATNPARFEVIKNNRTVILDGAHNSEAMKQLSLSVKSLFKNKNIYVLYTSMVDKPYYEMLKILNNLTKNIYLTTLPFPRVFKDFTHLKKQYKVFEDPLIGFNEIVKDSKENDIILVTGSMYLASEIRRELIKED